MNTVNYLKGLYVLRGEHGAIFVLTALLLPILFGFLGLGYDIGNLYVHKAKLQNTADAAALAGGREYVNSLKGANNQLTIEIPDDNKKATAKTALTGGATRYIRENNPVFASSGDTKYYIGVENHHTDSQDSNKVTGNTEYFRVNLTEPVKVYFMPVLGLTDSASVSVYATTKLSDTVLGNGGGDSFNDASYKPVMILGKVFNDRANTDDPGHVYKYYDSGTVYVVNGAEIAVGTMGQPRLDDEGDPAVPSHNGTGTITLYQDEINQPKVNSSKIVQIDYDMERFGIEVRKLFITEYINSLNISQDAKEKLEKERDNFISALRTWSQSKLTREKQYNEEYNRECQRRIGLYNAAMTSYNESLGLDKAVSIYNLILKYRQITQNAFYADQSKYNWQPINTYDLVKDAWKQEVLTLTNMAISDNDYFKNLICNCYSFPPPNQAPTSDNWIDQWNSDQGEWTNYTQFGITKPTASRPEKSTYISDAIMEEHMNAYMSQFPLDPEPIIPDRLQYYMTYVGDRMNPFKTSEISCSTTLSGAKHSYFYLSWNTAGYNAPQTNIQVDGFYINESEGITENTPFYLFVDKDILLEGVNITKIASRTDLPTGARIGNRPLVLCYMGPQGTPYNFDGKDKTDGQAIVLKGIIYAPRAQTEGYTNIPHINLNQQSFEGSFISTVMDMQNGGSAGNEVTLTYVDGKTEWGMTFTQNIGFDVSGNGSGSGGNEQSSFTLPERLKLWLEGKNKTDSYYKDEDITWQSLQ